MNMTSAIRLCVHIALENTPTINVKTYELLNQEYTEETALISNYIARSLADLPLIRVRQTSFIKFPSSQLQLNRKLYLLIL